MYSILFTHRTKILKLCLPTNGAFSFATPQEAHSTAKSKEPFHYMHSEINTYFKVLIML